MHDVAFRSFKNVGTSNLEVNWKLGTELNLSVPIDFHTFVTGFPYPSNLTLSNIQKHEATWDVASDQFCILIYQISSCISSSASFAVLRKFSYPILMTIFHLFSLLLLFIYLCHLISSTRVFFLFLKESILFFILFFHQAP